MVYIKLFIDYLDAVEPLSDAERGRLFTALLEYAKTGEAPQLSGNERFLFPMMRAQVDRDEEALTELSEKRSAAGRKGGRPAKASESKKSNCFSGKAKKANESKQSNCEQDKDKDKDEEKDEDGFFCAEPEAASPPPVVTLTLNDRTEYPVTEQQIAEWESLYPAVDVRQQLRNMKGWCDSNPSKRKTRNGILRFITGWLSREQDRGGRSKPKAPDERFVYDYGNTEGSL